MPYVFLTNIVRLTALPVKLAIKSFFTSDAAKPVFGV